MSDFWFGFVVFVLPFLLWMAWEVAEERGFKKGYETRDQEIIEDSERAMDAWYDSQREQAMGEW